MRSLSGTLSRSAQLFTQGDADTDHRRQRSDPDILHGPISQVGSNESGYGSREVHSELASTGSPCCDAEHAAAAALHMHIATSLAFSTTVSSALVADAPSLSAGL